MNTATTRVPESVTAPARSEGNSSESPAGAGEHDRQRPDEDHVHRKGRQQRRQFGALITRCTATKYMTIPVTRPNTTTIGKLR